MNERVEKAKYVLDSITNIMDFQEFGTGQRLWWCFCFGNLLEYIADKTFSFDYDIDLGVLYDECDQDKLISAFEGHGYKSKVTCVNDVTGKALNIHFKPIGDYIKDTPTLDVFFWYEHKGILYHTYDEKKTGNKMLEEYKLKGVPKEWLCPDKETIDRERNIGVPGREQMLNDRGTWRFPIFDDASSLTFRAPYKIGHLLDEWYGPTWRFRQYYKGQSMSRWVKKIKSFKELR